ncbi:MAG: molecular chaperone HtpG, partial [Pseudomonadota bacterium]
MTACAEGSKSAMNEFTPETSAAETFAFEADVGRVLEIVAHALYSDRDVFLRELIANASDSCDRLRFAALSQPELAGGADYAVTIAADAEAGLLTIQDNGFGLNRQDMVDNLGAIARSGAAAFVEAAKAAQAEGGDLRQIGQFGVGFYAAFMVAERVRVTARKAGEDALWVWSSDGKGSYAVGPPGDDDPALDGHGARIDLFLKNDAKEFLEAGRVEAAVRRRADHIGLPVFWIEAGGEQRQINAGQALWTRPKSELNDEQYAEAFRQFGGFGDPFATLHYRAEGVISFTALLFAPSRPGIDLFDPDRRNQLRLHVKQVFITDDRQDLVPAWLRFMVGVVDSEDLPLNVSRETPQATPVVARMRKTLTGRVLDLLKTKAKDDAEGFDAFWTAFGPVLKEGLYEDAERRDALFGLCRFHSTRADRRTDLAGYIERMKDG